MSAQESKPIPLGHAIQRVREQRRITTASLAGTTGIPRERIEALEDERYDPPYDVLLALADGLDVTPALVQLAQGADTPHGRERRAVRPRFTSSTRTTHKSSDDKGGHPCATIK